MNRRRLISAFALAGVSSCRRNGIGAGGARSTGDSVWPDQTYDRVVGYQFFNPWGPLKEGSPILDEGFHADKLARLKRKDIRLNASQTSRLIEASLNLPDNGAPAACYYPHHIFVFYKDTSVVAAIEVCFECHGKRTWPSATKQVGTDYPALAVLCREIGLGTDMPEDEKKIEWPDPFALPPLKR